MTTSEPETDGPKRIVVADDDVLFRERVTLLLERAGFEVVAQANEPTQLLTLVRAEKPDLAIVDINVGPPALTGRGLSIPLPGRERPFESVPTKPAGHL